MRAFDEINEFEDELIAGGAVVVKLWLAVSLQEQIEALQGPRGHRLQALQDHPGRLRNRDKWPAYEQAACDMFERYRHRGCAVDPGEADNKRLPASKS